MSNHRGISWKAFPRLWGSDNEKRGLSQIFAVNELLTVGKEIAAPDVVERANDSKCHC
jgi:hypothetical protein